MSDSFIGEIRMFGGSFAPSGWALCDGQLLAVSGNEALFSLLGTTYGGDGRTTFALPDLRGRVPVHRGTGPGLSPRRQGEKAGTETTTLSTNDIPSHSHQHFATDAPAGRTDPSEALLATGDAPRYAGAANLVSMAGDTLTPAGGNQLHTNVQPFLCVNFIIALFGTFPSRP